MATLTILLNEAHKSEDGLFPIIIRVEHQGRRRKMPIGYRIEKKYWRAGQIIGKHPDSVLINAAIASKEAEIRRYLADCQLHAKPIHLDLIGTGRASHSFTDYLRHRAEQYRAKKTKGGIIMSQKINRFVLELTETAGREVWFEDINLDFLRVLEQTMITNKNVENTRHKKFKFLGEFYSHAIQEGKALLPNPFHGYKIVTTPVKKEKLTASQVRAIEELKLRPGPIADARNLFLFSFYTKGQRFETCITLRRDQVRGGRIYFRTNKGKDYISVKIHERLRAILDLYPSGELVFPFLEAIPEDPQEYISAIGGRNTIFNRNLKVVSALAEIPIPITFHIARHTFAYQLKKVSDNINVVQDALGHSHQRTTQLYVKALEDEILDEEMGKLYGS